MEFKVDILKRGGLSVQVATESGSAILYIHHIFTRNFNYYNGFS